MRHRLAAITIALVGAMIVSLLPVLLSGQASTARTSPPRTPWGEPDLQGIWYNEESTPLQRPAEYAGREFRTEEEMAALAKRAASSPGRDRRAARGSEQDVAGAYNAVWSPGREVVPGRRTSQIIDPPDGKIPPMTAEGQRRASARREYLDALLQGTSGGKPGPLSPRRFEPPPFYNVDRMNRADSPEDRSSNERCMGASLPRLDARVYFRIVQSPGQVAVYYEPTGHAGANRIIPIGDRPALPSHIRLWLGDARARWEGETLVVETSNFTNKTEYQGSRESLRLTERFTRLGPETIGYQVTVQDPTTWTRPWTAVMELARQDDYQNRIFESSCHEGNFGMTGILSNTRAAEKAFAEGRGPDPATQDNATPGGGG